MTPPPAQGTADPYPKAVEWIRSAPSFHFDIAIGGAKASGDMSRARIGEERVRFRTKSDEWIAIRKPTGIAWYRNGKRDTNEPELADRVYQWVTVFPDPDKSPPATVGTEVVAGEPCDHIRFTNLNSKEAHDVWVSRADNHLVRLKTSFGGSAFPPVELTITRPGAPVTIEEPKS